MLLSSLGCSGGLSVGGGAVMRQKFGDAVDGMVGDAGEDVFKPSEGVDIHTLAGGYETGQHRTRLTADITAKKHPVAATQRHTTNTALRACVIDLQISVFRVAVQRCPVF